MAFFQVVVDEYAESFKDVLSFENLDHKDHAVLNAFTDTLHKVSHGSVVLLVVSSVCGGIHSSMPVLTAYFSVIT